MVNPPMATVRTNSTMEVQRGRKNIPSAHRVNVQNRTRCVLYRSISHLGTKTARNEMGEGWVQKKKSMMAGNA